MNYFQLSDNIDDLEITRDMVERLLYTETITDERVKEKLQEDLWDLTDAIDRLSPTSIAEENNIGTDE